MNSSDPKIPAFSFDAFIPPEMAERAEKIGVQKAAMGWRTMLALGVLAGGFISMGAVFSTTVTAGATGQLPYGVTRLLGGLVFSLGLILVVVAGAELFTGNNLIIMAWANGRVTIFQVLRNWLLVYVGNFAGAVSTAVLMYISSQYCFGKGAVGINILNTAAAKCQFGFIQAIALGIACNALVCMAVWLCYSARTTTDKILSIIFPITAFVAAGFEHSIANMYFILIGLFIKTGAPSVFWETIGKTASEFAGITWTNFIFANLLPVTIGNIFGGAVMVGLIYWFIYLRKGLVPKST
ncbi:MAG TPA: formate transporter FocA [Deltaproteobacteria bacterium]|nr:formate transporter FocA [Deltaproteobacteria bacterium]